MRGSIPGPWDPDLSQRQMLNRLSHPGVPTRYLCKRDKNSEYLRYLSYLVKGIDGEKDVFSDSVGLEPSHGSVACLGKSAEQVFVHTPGVHIGALDSLCKAFASSAESERPGATRDLGSPRRWPPGRGCPHTSGSQGW